jgi:hypothetical protein
MSQPPLTCRNGHPLSPEDAVCPACGAPTGPAVAQPAAPGRPSISRTTVVVLAVVVAVVLLGGAAAIALLASRSDDAPDAPVAAAPSKAPPTTTITGAMLLNDLKAHLTGCREATVFYTDIAPGAPVLIKDEANAIIGTGSLGPGRKEGTRACLFEFSVPNVRADANVYTVEVGTSGNQQKTREQAAAEGWKFELKLGV